MKIKTIPSSDTYSQLRNRLLSDVRERRLRRGQPIDSIREISRRYGVTRAVAEKAVSSLVADGICLAEHGRGVFLAVDEPVDPAVTATLGVVLGYREYPLTDTLFFRHVFEGAKERIIESGFNVMQFYQWRKKNRGQKARELAGFSDRLAGLLALGIYSDDDCIQLRDTRIPTVILDYDTTPLGVDCAILDNRRAFADLGGRLAALGAQSFFLVRSPRFVEDDPARLDRLEGLCRAVGDVTLIEPPAGEPGVPAAVLDPISKAVASGRRPAVVCEDQEFVQRRLKGFSGSPLAPGRDFLLGYSGPAAILPELAAVPAAVATFDFPALGRLGMKLLSERMASGPGRARKALLPGDIREHVPVRSEL